MTPIVKPSGITSVDAGIAPQSSGTSRLAVGGHDRTPALGYTLLTMLSDSALRHEPFLQVKHITNNHVLHA
jgi:hypothetical protein